MAYTQRGIRKRTSRRAGSCACPALFIAVFEALFGEQSDIEVVVEVSTATNAVERIARLRRTW